MVSRPRGLIDTGAILALLNRQDRWHTICREALTTLTFPLATSAAILAEVFHLLPGVRDVPRAWTFLKSGAVTVLPITDDDLPAIEALMDRYQDRPMDFADATLVHLAAGFRRELRFEARRAALPQPRASPWDGGGKSIPSGLTGRAEGRFLSPLRG